MLTTGEPDTLGNALHLVRMMVLHPQAAKECAKGDEGFDLIKLICAVAVKAGKETVHQLALWALANFFSRRALSKYIAKRSEEVSIPSFLNFVYPFTLIHGLDCISIRF